MNIKVLTDEQIVRILEENRPEHDGPDKAIEVSRAIEQAVLQSPEIRELRKNAERIRFIADDCCAFSIWIQEDCTVLYRLEWNHGDEWQPEWYATPEEAVDAAMEKQP